MSQLPHDAAVADLGKPWLCHRSAKWAKAIVAILFGTALACEIRSHADWFAGGDMLVTFATLRMCSRG